MNTSRLRPRILMLLMSMAVLSLGITGFTDSAYATAEQPVVDSKPGVTPTPARDVRAKSSKSFTVTNASSTTLKVTLAPIQCMKASGFSTVNGINLAPGQSATTTLTRDRRQNSINGTILNVGQKGVAAQYFNPEVRLALSDRYNAKQLVDPSGWGIVGRILPTAPTMQWKKLGSFLKKVMGPGNRTCAQATQAPTIAVGADSVPGTAGATGQHIAAAYTLGKGSSNKAPALRRVDSIGANGLSVGNTSSSITVGDAPLPEDPCSRTDKWIECVYGPASGRANTPLGEIVWPGTHDSATATILAGTQNADQPQPCNQTNWMPIMKAAPNTVYSWATVQPLTVRQQLDGGIRHLDIRAIFDSTRGSSSWNQWRTAHTNLGESFAQNMQQVTDWAAQHPNEVIHTYWQDLCHYDANWDSLLEALGMDSATNTATPGTFCDRVYKGTLASTTSVADVIPGGKNVLMIWGSNKQPFSPALLAGCTGVNGAEAGHDDYRTWYKPKSGVATDKPLPVAPPNSPMPSAIAKCGLLDDFIESQYSSGKPNFTIPTATNWIVEGVPLAGSILWGAEKIWGGIATGLNWLFKTNIPKNISVLDQQGLNVSDNKGQCENGPRQIMKVWYAGGGAYNPVNMTNTMAGFDPKTGNRDPSRPCPSMAVIDDGVNTDGFGPFSPGYVENLIALNRACNPAGKYPTPPSPAPDPPAPTITVDVSVMNAPAHWLNDAWYPLQLAVSVPSRSRTDSRTTTGVNGTAAVSVNGEQECNVTIVDGAGTCDIETPLIPGTITVTATFNGEVGTEQATGSTTITGKTSTATILRGTIRTGEQCLARADVRGYTGLGGSKVRVQQRKGKRWVTVATAKANRKHHWQARFRTDAATITIRVKDQASVSDSMVITARGARGC